MFLPVGYSYNAVTRRYRQFAVGSDMFPDSTGNPGGSTVPGRIRFGEHILEPGSADVRRTVDGSADLVETEPHRTSDRTVTDVVREHGVSRSVVDRFTSGNVFQSVGDVIAGGRCRRTPPLPRGWLA
jgi:hypothetical protein